MYFRECVRSAISDFSFNGNKHAILTKLINALEHEDNEAISISENDFSTMFRPLFVLDLRPAEPNERPNVV